jgi:hypothetical protein
MTSQMPITRTQMLLARGGILGCVLMVVFLNIFGLGSVKSIREGDATIYTGSSMNSVLMGILGILTAIIAIVFWLQRSPLFTLFSVLLFGSSIFVFINVPSGFNHCLVVTPDTFDHRIGVWYSPIEHHIEFADVLFLQIAESEPVRNNRKYYELQCFMKPDGKIIAVPISDLMRAALPEIFRRAVAREIMIGEGDDGLQIPTQLSEG